MPRSKKGRYKTKAMAARPKTGPNAIPQATVEGIKAMYLQDRNKAKIARMFNVSVMTVYRILGKDDPEEQREYRQEKMAKTASAMIDIVDDLAQNLRTIPENATYMQKATVLGILTDKVEKLDKRLAESKFEDKMDAVPLPETVEAMAGALRNELRKVQLVMQIFPDGNKLLDEVRQMEAATGRHLIARDVTEAEIVSIDDLDAIGEVPPHDAANRSDGAAIPADAAQIDGNGRPQDE